MEETPTESSLLTNFLLPPAPLPIALPLADFTKLFPPEQRSSPDIPVLYRELQYQVSLGIDEVKRNIAAEVARGEEIRIQIARSRRKTNALNGLVEEGELAMDVEMHGPKDDDDITAVHTERSILKEMDVACEHIEEEIQALEEETRKMLEDLKSTVGGLSDLRYGRFTKSPGSTEEFGEEIVHSIKRLQEICDDARMGASNG